MINGIKKSLQPSYQFVERIVSGTNFPTFLQFKIFRFFYYRTGLKIFKKLHRQYRQDCTICICPYKGTGDVYLASAFFKGSAFDTKKSVFCVIGASNKKISELFRLNAKVLQFSQKEINSITRLSFFVGLEASNVKILHHAPINWHSGINDMFRNINGLDFTDLIGYGAFNIKDSKKLAKPHFLEKDDQTDALFGNGKLKKGKTVLLSPFSYTLSVLPNWFWKKLAKELTKLGYSVCTNLGSKKEKTIEGTEGVFLRYEQLGVFLKNAGYFIGIRSGFCDVISSIPCKKIVLYQPYMFWGDGENIDYFSLNKIGLCDDAIELQHKGIDFFSLIEEIKKNMEENNGRR